LYANLHEQFVAVPDNFLSKAGKFMDITKGEITKEKDAGVVFDKDNAKANPLQLLEEIDRKPSGKGVLLGSIAEKEGTLCEKNWQTARNAVLVTAGIHSIVHLALTITGNDTGNMKDDFMVDPVNGLNEMDSENLENILAQCLAAIESANNRMLSILIEHCDSLNRTKIP